MLGIYKSNYFKIYLFRRLALFVFTIFLCFIFSFDSSLLGQTKPQQKSVSLGNICSSLFDFSENTSDVTISENESHCYKFIVEKDQYLGIRVHQKGVDVKLQLFKGTSTAVDSNQNEQDKWTPLTVPIDSPDETRGPELVSVTAAEKIIVTLVITSKEQESSNPTYTVEAERNTSVNQNDKNFIATQLKWMEGIFNASENYTKPDLLQPALMQIKQAKDEMPSDNQLTVWQKQTKQNLLHSTGYIYLDLGANEQALNYFKQYIDVSSSLDDPDGRMKGLTLAGVSAKNIGLNRLAYDYYEEATKVENVSDLAARANLLLNFAVVLSEIGLLEKALGIFAQAKKTYEQAEKGAGDKFDQAKAYLNHGIGRIYMSLGQDELAIDYIKKALEYSSPGGKVIFHDAAAFEHLYLGVIYDRQNKPEDSKKETNLALKIWEDLNKKGINTTSQIINALNNLAFDSLKKGDKTKAVSYFNEASKYLDDGVNKYYKAFILTNTAKIDIDDKNYQKASEKLKEALELGEAASSTESQVSTLNVMAYYEKVRGNLPAAASILKQAIDKIEFVRTNVSSVDLRTTLFSNVQHIYLQYVDVLMQLDKQMPRNGFAEKALVISDNMRARGLSEILITAGVDVRKDVKPELLAREKNLQTQVVILLSKKQGYSQLPKNDTRVVNLESEINRTVESLRVVRDEIKKFNPQYSILTTAEMLTTKQIQNLLPPDTVLLEYSITPDHSYLWLVSDREILGFPILFSGKEVSQKELEDLVKDALVSVQQLDKNDRQAKTDRSFLTYKEISRRLSRMLLEPVADKIKGKRLVISSDGILQFLPFSALPIPGGNSSDAWQPLIKQNEITIIPSASALSALIKRQRRSPPQYLAALVSPLYQLEKTSGKNNLQMNDKFSKIENLNLGDTLIKRLLTTAQTANLKDKVKIWTGSEVARDTATSSELSNYRNILYYAHGVFDDSRPESSGLYLSFYDRNLNPRPDKFLGLSDIYSMNLNADVVFLSGCETSLGKEIKGEGIVGITRGFMYAGSANVVSSLWKVPEPETMLIVDRFFKEAALQGKRPSEILRKIQTDIWEKDNLPPYYWAAFQIHGIP